MNGLFLRRVSQNTCWICGSRDSLTREHKFKASDIRKIYEQQKLFVHRGELGSGDVKIAQGIKSKAFKFDSFICEKCNSCTTQKSDFAYNAVSDIALQHDPIERRISLIQEREDLDWIEINRFFSKQFGCRLVEIGAPIPRRLSRFVARKNNTQCLTMMIRPDPGYLELKGTDIEDLIPAISHDGLIVIYDKKRRCISRARSSYSINGVQFLFEYKYARMESLEINLIHRDFEKRILANESPDAGDRLVTRSLKRLGFEE